MGVVNLSTTKYLQYRASEGVLMLNKEVIPAWQGELVDLKVETEYYEGKAYNVYSFILRDHDDPDLDALYKLQLAEKSMTTKFLINALASQDIVGNLMFKAWKFEDRTGLTVWNNGVKLDKSQAMYPWNMETRCWDGVPPIVEKEFEGEVIKSDKKQLEFWRGVVQSIAKRLNPEGIADSVTAEVSSKPAPAAQKSTKGSKGKKKNVVAEHEEIAAGYDDASVIADSWEAIAASIADQPELVKLNVTKVWQARVKELGADTVLNHDGTLGDDLPF